MAIEWVLGQPSDNHLVVATVLAKRQNEESHRADINVERVQGVYFRLLQ